MTAYLSQNNGLAEKMVASKGIILFNYRFFLRRPLQITTKCFIIC